MPDDMREAMRKAGLRMSEDPRGHGPRGPAGADNPFPPGYPKYFTDDGHTRVELVKEEAERIADRFFSDNLKRHQLRAFYDHAKKQSQRLAYGAPFGEVHMEVARLKAFAADRLARGNIPASFKQFIYRNIDAVTNQKSFAKGLMPHFEAVVAYCARIKE